MKRIYIFLFILSIATGECFGQDGNFFPTGMKWQEAIVEDGVINMVGNHTHTYEIGSDKSFGDVVYKEVFVDGTAANLWVREEGNKVWLLSEDYSQEILLYDFNWDAGTGFLYTEYLRGNGDGYDVKTLESFAAYRTLTINGRDYQYHQEDAGTVIRNIGRVYELNRNSSLLGYKVPEGIIPGLIYWKVLWIEKGGEVVFQSDSPGEWNMHLGNPPVVTIDGLWYFIYKPSHLAMLANYNQWTGKLDIPEQVSYEGEEYTVDRIEWLAFNQCQTLTKVRIPKTVRDIEHYAGYEDCKNPFDGCSSLESIEVDKDNPRMCSVDGVLFSKDKTMLYCYPAGVKSESYTVPDGVTWIGSGAFGYNGLTLLDIPESVKGFGEGVFRWTHLKKIAIRGTFPNGLRNDTFDAMDEATVLYVRQSEIEKFKKVFSGTILPLEEYMTNIEQVKQHQQDSPLFDLHGRRLSGQPTKGIYIQNGKKVVVK